MPSPDRRTFLAGSAAGALALGAPAAHALGANEKLNIGLIGSGNRGRTIAQECVKAGHNVVAAADVAKFRHAFIAEKLAEVKGPRPEMYDDYRKLLEHRGLDAVIIATPDHHHKEHLIAVMEAGKHAYCEKPLSHTIEQGKEMVAAVRKAKKVVQVGNQRHSGEHWARAREVVQSGDFGDLVWVKVWDCRNWIKRDPFTPPKTFDAEQIKGVNWDAFLGTAKKRAFDPVRYWAWRWYWDYAGGLLTDIGAHQLDIVQWLGGVDAPRSVTANGGVYHFKHWCTVSPGFVTMREAQEFPHGRLQLRAILPRQTGLRRLSSAPNRAGRGVGSAPGRSARYLTRARSRGERVQGQESRHRRARRVPSAR